MTTRDALDMLIVLAGLGMVLHLIGFVSACRDVLRASGDPSFAAGTLILLRGARRTEAGRLFLKATLVTAGLVILAVFDRHMQPVWITRVILLLCAAVLVMDANAALDLRDRYRVVLSHRRRRAEYGGPERRKP